MAITPNAFSKTKKHHCNYAKDPQIAHKFALFILLPLSYEVCLCYWPQKLSDNRLGKKVKHRDFLGHKNTNDDNNVERLIELVHHLVLSEAPGSSTLGFLRYPAQKSSRLIWGM